MPPHRRYERRHDEDGEAREERAGEVQLPSPARAEQADAVHVQLTPRERQVATLLAYGYTNVEIANRLTISVRTAEMHRANAMRKLAAERRADVVRWALDHQLLR